MATEAVLARVAKPDGNRMLLDAKALMAAPREVGLRTLAALLMGVSGEPYRPRFDALERLFDRIAAGKLGGGATLHGCRVFPAPRASQAFMLAARARALLDGRLTPSTDDIVALAGPVLRHRMALSFSARAEGATTAGVIEKLCRTLL